VYVEMNEHWSTANTFTVNAVGKGTYEYGGTAT